MAKLLEERILYRNPDLQVTPAETLGRKVVGLYFSASWCPPCRQFTTILKDVYTELKGRGAAFEVVFVSLDRSDEELQLDLETMHGDWLYLPFGDPFINELQDRYDIIAIPQLVIIRPDGDVITPYGRKQVQDRGVSCFTSWAQELDKI